VFRNEACTNCVPGKYDFVSVCVASGLLGSNSNIARSTLEEWTAAGVSEWKLSNAGDSCNTACSNSGLQCHSNILSKTYMVAMLAYLGRPYFFWTNTKSDGTLMCDNVYPRDYTSVWCYYQEIMMSKCDVSYAYYLRLCVCGSSSFTVTSSQGSSTCSDCVAGKYLSTEGKKKRVLFIGTQYSNLYTAVDDESTDCVQCETGKYSVTLAAPSADVCITCVLHECGCFCRQYLQRLPCKLNFSKWGSSWISTQSTTRHSL
jgi:hypothetical protein